MNDVAVFDRVCPSLRACHSFLPQGVLRPEFLDVDAPVLEDVHQGLGLARRQVVPLDEDIAADNLLPPFMSYPIVNLTLAVPRIILAETSLSFLGLGIRAPAVSWGSLRRGCAFRVPTPPVRPASRPVEASCRGSFRRPTAW